MTFTSYFDWIQKYGDPSNARLMFGFLPAYPMFMFAGMLLVILASVIKLKTKGIPLREFEIATLLVVPIGALGASIFGKIFLPGMIWYHIFFIWEPGMSLFGGLIFGSLAGFVWFYRRSKTTLISVWVYADCIIPNLLLGQMLGRWGNFYNHEILGQVVSYDSLRWLPSFIRNELFYFPNLLGFDELPANWAAMLQNHELDLGIIATSGQFKGQTLESVLMSNIEYRAPLFLIEGIGGFVLWTLITFLVPNLNRWFNKTKPWDLDSKAYPGWFNKKHKHLPNDEVTTIETIVPIKYKTKVYSTPNGDRQELSMSLRKAWQKAYYWQGLDEKNTCNFEQKQIQHEKVWDQIQKGNFKYQAPSKQKQISKNPSLKNKLNQHQYSQREKWNYIWRGKPYGRELELANNPHQFFIVRCGVESSSYLIGYLILRIILETQRQTTELMIPEQPIIDFILLSLILIFAICLLVVAQWIAPYRYREVGWLYEKSY